MALNKELIAKVRNHIIEEPRRYVQKTYGDKVAVEASPCGTQACIAGWAAILSGRVAPANIEREPQIHSIAQEEMGLSENQANNLFLWNWPEDYDERYYEAETPQEKAQIAADLLTDVIDTNGAILN